jgi:hypothetical protein
MCALIFPASKEVRELQRPNRKSSAESTKAMPPKVLI